LEGFVSKRWTGVTTLAIVLSVVWLVFILNGSPWAGFAWVASLSFAAALWAARRGNPDRSIGQVLADLDAQPAPSAAVTVPAPPPAPKPVR
jgi:hypothetical protein